MCSRNNSILTFSLMLEYFKVSSVLFNGETIVKSNDLVNFSACLIPISVNPGLNILKFSISFRVE